METKVQQMEVDATSVKNIQAIEGSEPGTFVFIQLTFLGDKCEYDSDPVGIVAKLTGRTVEAA